MFAQLTANFSWAQSQPNVIDFTDLSTIPNPGMTIYEWNYGDSQVEYAMQGNAQHHYSTPGTYNVCLNLLDSTNMATSSYCATITVTGTFSCIMTAGSYPINQATCPTCADGSASIYAMNGSAPFTYLWSNGETTQTAVSLLPGANSCCVTDQYGCVACDTVNTTSVPCSFTFTYSTFMSGWTAFNSQVWWQNQAPTVTWNFGDATTGAGLNPAHQYAQSGVYAVCATMYDQINQCTVTWCDSISVYVYPQLTCNAAFSIVEDSVNTNSAWITNMCVGGSGMTYLWTWGDSSPSDTGAYPTHTYQNYGTYMICVEIDDQVNQCSDTFCLSVAAYRMMQPTSLSPYYVNVVPPVLLGIDENNAGTEWMLSPNPANSLITVNGTFTANDGYYVTDLSGRAVASGTLATNVVDVNSLCAGIYIFTLVKDNGQIESKRFIRE